MALFCIFTTFWNLQLIDSHPNIPSESQRESAEPVRFTTLSLLTTNQTILVAILYPDRFIVIQASLCYHWPSVFDSKVSRRRDDERVFTPQLPHVHTRSISQMIMTIQQKQLSTPKHQAFVMSLKLQIRAPRVYVA